MSDGGELCGSSLVLPVLDSAKIGLCVSVERNSPERVGIRPCVLPTQRPPHRVRGPWEAGSELGQEMKCRSQAHLGEPFIRVWSLLKPGCSSFTRHLRSWSISHCCLPCGNCGPPAILQSVLGPPGAVGYQITWTARKCVWP